MKRNAMKKIALCAAAALCLLAAGCGSQYTEQDVPYAGDMLENVLAGIAGDDYETFSRDFTDDMKTAIPEDSLTAFAAMLKEKIGDYQSKTFAGAAEKTEDGVRYMSVVYSARYSGETADVIITINFTEENGTQKVAGFFMTSPNLRK